MTLLLIMTHHLKTLVFDLRVYVRISGIIVVKSRPPSTLFRGLSNMYLCAPILKISILQILYRVCRLRNCNIIRESQIYLSGIFNIHFLLSHLHWHLYILLCIHRYFTVFLWTLIGYRRLADWKRHLSVNNVSRRHFRETLL